MTQTTQVKRGNYLLPIIITFALFFMIAFVTGYQNPLGSIIKEISGGSTAWTQLGNLMNFIAYAFMGYPAGLILQKYGYRMTALLASIVGFVGVLLTFISGTMDASQSSTAVLTVYMLGAFVAGFSMCMLNSVVNPLMNSMGSTPDRGNQMLQFGGAFNSLGATLAPIVVGYIIGGQATAIAEVNPVFFMCMGIFALAIVVLYFSKLPEAPDFGQAKEKIDAKGAFRYSNFVLGIIAIFCYVGVEVGIANITMQYISNEAIPMQNGIAVAQPETVAGFIVGMYWLLMLVGRLLGGVLGTKMSSRTMLTSVCVIAMCFVGAAILMSPEMTASIVGISKDGGLSFEVFDVRLSVLMLVLCGLCTSVMWGAIFSLSVVGLGRYPQVASGIFMVMVCGGGILPMVQGMLVDSMGYLNSFWLVFGLIGYMLFYALVGSRTKKA